jgi:hypothetical protein
METETQSSRRKIISAGVVVLIVLWLGVSWRYGWFPFAGGGTSLEQMRQDATAQGTDANFSAGMLEAATVSGSSQLSAEEEAALVEAATAP